MAREIVPGVIGFDDGRILTKNFAPGKRVYDEELHTVEGVEYRTWNPTRSKLGAYLLKGGRNFPLQADSKVLYLGAANGTTPSHVSDCVPKGVLVAVEFSPRSFRDLLRVAGDRPNMVPVLADAWRPELYQRFLGRVDFLFQDIAQRQQAAIFAKNLLAFKPAWAMLAIKARSVDVAANPRDVYARVAEDVSALSGYDVIETVDLGPFEKDHAAIVLRPAGKAAKARPQEVRADQRGAGEERRYERPQRGGFERGPREGGFQPRGGGFGGKPGFGKPRGRFEGGERGPPRGGYDKRPYDKQERPGGFNRGGPREGGYDRPPREGGFQPRREGGEGGGFRPRRDDEGGGDRPKDNRRKWR